jgi:hypothetical protein
MTGFDPTTYDDHTLGSWGKKRLAVLEHEANRRKLNIQPTPKNDRHPM